MASQPGAPYASGPATIYAGPTTPPSAADFNSFRDWINWLIAVTPFAQAAGEATVTMSSVSNVSIAVTFPTGRFSVAPRVVCSPNGGNSKIHAQATAITATGFTLYVSSGDGTSITVSTTCDWHAVQMQSGAASG